MLLVGYLLTSTRGVVSPTKRIILPDYTDLYASTLLLCENSTVSFSFKLSEPPSKSVQLDLVGSSQSSDCTIKIPHNSFKFGSKDTGSALMKHYSVEALVNNKCQNIPQILYTLSGPSASEYSFHGQGAVVQDTNPTPMTSQPVYVVPQYQVYFTDFFPSSKEIYKDIFTASDALANIFLCPAVPPRTNVLFSLTSSEKKDMFKENPLVFGSSEQLKIVNATMSQKNGKRNITIQLGKGSGYSLRSGDGWKIVDATLIVTPPSPPKYLLVDEQKEINFTMPAFSKDIPYVTITPFTLPPTSLKIVPAVLNFSKAGTQQFTLQAGALMDSSFALGVTYDALIICLSLV
jgi:hypothetical protein